MTRAGARRGIALLLVLAALVLATGAAAALARAASAARLRAGIARDERIAEGLLRAAEAPILDWLHRHAGRVVLPIDARSARFGVLDDPLVVDGVRCRVTITAFDQCGMVSGRALFAPMVAVLPDGVAESAGSAGRAFADHPGLDAIQSSPSMSAFPPAEEGRAPALGELVATHNPAREGGTPVLNVNTAPMPLAAAVYRARGMGIEAVADARAAGRLASPGAAREPRSAAGDGIPLPVSMSTAWAFRIDCRAGGLVRSWWTVYLDTGSNWERVQRLVIDD